MKEEEYPTLKIPPLTLDSFERYAKYHIPTGDFLRAVLSNDLMQAFGRADDFNRRALFDICRYIYNELPAECWGSPETYNKWISNREEVSIEEDMLNGRR